MAFDGRAPSDYQEMSYPMDAYPEGYPSVYVVGVCIMNGEPGALAGIGNWWGHKDPRNVSAPLLGPRQCHSRAEIQSAIRAILQARATGNHGLIINTDSMVLVNAVNLWMPDWERNGWKRANGRDVVNRWDFEGLAKAQNGLDIHMQHVPAHHQLDGTKEATRLATEAIFKRPKFISSRG